ncbi:hypothetical protein D3C81_358450 [compost metagenome]
MNNLKKLIVYFLKHSPRLLGRTDLMKYVFSFEYYYFQLKKEQYTETKFVRYHYGPNDTLVVDATLSLEKEGIVKITEGQNAYGSISYQHKYVGTIDDPYEGLPEEAELVACFIIDRLGKESYRGVIDFAYDIPPMRFIIEEESRGSTKFNGRVLDMDQKEKVFKSTRQQKEEARKRLKARLYSDCSSEEYYAHLMEQQDMFEDVRRRISIVDKA